MLTPGEEVEESDLTSLNLTPEDIELLIRLGVVVRYAGKLHIEQVAHSAFT